MTEFDKRKKGTKLLAPGLVRMTGSARCIIRQFRDPQDCRVNDRYRNTEIAVSMRSILNRLSNRNPNLDLFSCSIISPGFNDSSWNFARRKKRRKTHNRNVKFDSALRWNGLDSHYWVPSISQICTMHLARD